MSNSDSPFTSPPTPAKTSPAARPHRRLSLLQSTQSEAPTAENSSAKAAPQDVTAPAPELAPDSATNTDSTEAGTVRVMAYLSAEEARILDETWLKLRSQPSRPSKSDILRAVCTLATQDFEMLAAILLKQQSSTLSRQRSSKARKS